MSQRGMGDLMEKLRESEGLDETSKEILKFLITENAAKNARNAQLESEVTQIKIKVNQIERYQSKDCLIFRNLPFSTSGTYLSDVICLIQNVLNVNIEPSDIKACHPLGRGSPFNPPPIIAKFLYFEQKERIWTRKGLLRNFQNPNNGKPVYIHERLSKYDLALKEDAEAKQLKVTTKNSAPLVQIQSEGMTRYLELNSTKDIAELQPIAKKMDQVLNRFSMNAHSSQRQASRTDTNSMQINPNNFNTPVPKLSKPPNFTPGTPLSTKMPSLKRVRESVEENEYRNLLEELKSRRANKDELLDFVMGLISDSPNAKETFLDSIEEQPFRIEEDSEDYVT